MEVKNVDGQLGFDATGTNLSEAHEGKKITRVRWTQEDVDKAIEINNFYPDIATRHLKFQEAFPDRTLIAVLVKIKKVKTNKTRRWKAWNTQEDAFLTAHPKKSDAWIAKKLKRTKHAVYVRRHNKKKQLSKPTAINALKKVASKPTPFGDVKTLANIKDLRVPSIGELDRRIGELQLTKTLIIKYNETYN